MMCRLTFSLLSVYLIISSSKCPHSDNRKGSLQDLVGSKTKYFIVGGKGGVGKTSVASALALKLAKLRDQKVLLISTDPAHSLHDAFNITEPSGKPHQIGDSKLWVFEMDTSKARAKEVKKLRKVALKTTLPNMQQQVEQLTGMLANMPGADEITAISHAMEEIVKKEKFELIIFDTAPTGHTTKMLKMPQVLAQSLAGNVQQQQQMIAQVGQMPGIEDHKEEIDRYFNSLMKYLEGYRKRVEDVGKVLNHKSDTDFVIVTLAEPLAVSETERLFLDLEKQNIPIGHVVCNQLLKLDASTKNDLENTKLPASIAKATSLAIARSQLQATYLEKLKAIDSCLDVVEAPLLSSELVGIDALDGFGDKLFGPGGEARHQEL